MIPCAGNKSQYIKCKGRQFAKFYLTSIRKPCVDIRQQVKPDDQYPLLFNPFLLKLCPKWLSGLIDIGRVRYI